MLRHKLFLDYVHVERNEIQEAGEYDLEGLFVRLQSAIESVSAKRFLDTVEALFSGFSNMGILRAELRRLFRWLKDRGLTTIITAERGEGTLTRNGLEEYVSDCVILLDHRVIDQISTRRLRVVKYRGTVHGSNEYPFLIDQTGVSVLPITSLALKHEVSTQRISTGIPDLDGMLGGKGLYRGSTVLVSGTAGSGKSSIAAHFADKTCRQGERCIFLGIRGIAGTGRSETCDRLVLISSPGSERACCNSAAPGPPSTALKCTWRGSTSWWKNSDRARSSWIRSRT